MKKFITGYLTVFLLLVGLYVALELSQKPQDLQQQASTTGVDLKINAPTAAVVGTPINVPIVILATNNHTITAADITLTYSNNLRLDSLSRGDTITNTDYFNSSGMTYPPTATDTKTQTLNYTDLTKSRMAVGAYCDVCFLGPTPNPAPNPAVPACGTTAPKCYPKTGTGTIITARFTPLTSGTATINFDTETTATPEFTQIASVQGLDNNVRGDTTGATINISGTAICIIDLDGNGSVGLADYGVFKTRYLAYLSTGVYDATIDLDRNNAIGLSDYGVFKTKYLAYLSTGICN